MKISIVRGAFLNPFELQNYYPLAKKFKIQAISSKRPISDKIRLPLIKLWSLTDSPNFPYKYPILNRLLVDAHYLVGLEKIIAGSDIVHVAETYYHYTIQAIKAKQKGLVKKVISTVWEIIPHNNEGIRGRKDFKKLAYQNVDHFIAITQLAKKALIKEGASPKKISVIPMGVDLKRFHPSKRKSKTINILSVARLVEEKGIGDLIEVFRALKSQYKNLHLTLVGDGPLKNHATEAGASIKSMGYDQVHRAYQQADIFCLLSKPTRYWQEQYGMALVEAMASGLPIVATRSGALPEVGGKVVQYVKPGNAKQIRGVLAKLIEDKSLRKRLGQASRKLACKQYDYQKIAQKISRVYHSLIS